MFRDGVQASRAIRLLLARLGLDALWSDAGPSSLAQLSYPEGDARPPQGRRTLLLAALSLWNPAAGGALLGDVLSTLDRGTCLSLGSLIVAYAGGPDAVDAWIEAASARVSEPPLPAAPAPAAPPPAVAPSGPARTSISDDWPTLDVLRVRYAGRVLDHVKHNKSRAAEVLDVDRRTVSRLLDAASRDAAPAAKGPRVARRRPKKRGRG